MKKILMLFIFIFVAVIATTSTYAATYVSIELPDDFDWVGPDVNILKNEEGYFTDLDVTDYKVNVSGITMYVSKDGSDTTGDGSELTPYLTIDKAITMGAETIYVDSGWYNYVENFINFTPYDGIEVNIIGLDSDVYLTRDKELDPSVFSLSSTREYTYEYTYESIGSFMQIFDRSALDENGGFKKYTEVESINEVEATPGSYFKDLNTTTFYIHMLDGLAPDTDLYIDMASSLLNIKNSTVYLENLHLYGGTYTVLSDNSNIYAKNVEFAYSQESGLKSYASRSIIVDSVANYNAWDGFSYGNPYASSALVWAIEVDNTASYNGLDDPDNLQNGSSLHQNARIIRINGEYSYNKGPNVHDIGESQSVNYGTTAHHSLADTADRNTNFRLGETTALNLMWLYDTVSYGSTNDYQVEISDDINDSQMFIGGYDLTGVIEDVELTPGGSIVAPESETLSFLGIAWYWWIAGIGVFYFVFTKKGRKALGFKK